MKKFVLSAVFLGALSMALSNILFADKGPEMDEQIFKNILGRIYQHGGWARTMRRNMDVTFDIEDYASKEYYPLGGAERRIYRVEYAVTFTARNDCRLFKVIPDDLGVFLQGEMKLECYGDNDEIRKPTQKFLEDGWRVRREYRRSHSTLLRARESTKVDGLVLYVAINNNLQNFRMALKSHWYDYSKMRKRYMMR